MTACSDRRQQWALCILSSPNVLRIEQVMFFVVLFIRILELRFCKGSEILFLSFVVFLAAIDMIRFTVRNFSKYSKAPVINIKYQSIGKIYLIGQHING